MNVKLVSLAVGLSVASLFAGQLAGQTPPESEDHARASSHFVPQAKVIVGQVPGYSADNANEEGYWYSRYSMMTLTMQSGLGTAIPVDANFMNMMQQMIAAVGAAPNDPVVPPVNPTLLKTIYAGGDPHYVSTPNQMDFSTLKWVGGPPKFTTESTAMTMTKELEWAKLFHRDRHFGQAQVDTFGSSQRFVGMVLATMVKAQMQAYFAQPDKYEQSKAGDYGLLIALSDAVDVYSATDEANNQGPNAGPATYPAENRYADPIAAAGFAPLARAQFAKVVHSHPTKVRDLSLAIQSVVWYASISQDATELAEARRAIETWGSQLAEESDDDEEGPSVLAYRVRGLIETGRTTGTEMYFRSAVDAFTRLTANFDTVHGVLRGTKTLTIDDIGEIAGAFNAAGIWLGNRIDQNAATAIFGAWWEGNVNLSGLEISSPAVNQFKGPYELLNPPGRGTTPQAILNYRYPTVPLPENAGGAHGVAPVFAASVTWNDKGWRADQDHFDTGGAMHAANEMIWFHSDEINGFPVVNFQ